MDYDAYNAGLNSVKNYKKSNLGRNALIGLGIFGAMALSSAIYKNSENISDSLSSAGGFVVDTLNPQTYLPSPKELFGEDSGVNFSINNNGGLEKTLIEENAQNNQNVVKPNTTSSVVTKPVVEPVIEPTVSVGYEICKGQNINDVDSTEYLSILEKGMENAYGADTGCEFTNNWHSQAVNLLNDMRQKGDVSNGSYNIILNTTNAIYNRLK